MPATVGRMAAHITSTTMNGPEIAAACDEAGSMMGLKLSCIILEETSLLMFYPYRGSRLQAWGPFLPAGISASPENA